MKNSLKMFWKWLDFLLIPMDRLHWFWLIPLAASAITGLIANRQAKKSRELSKSESELAFQRQQQMIAQQNQYNDPASQLQRFRGAGLNPNLIYGSGSASAGNQTQSASYEPQRQTDFPAVAIPQMLSEYQNFQMRAAQIDNVKAQTENTHQKTMTEAITRYVKQLQGQTGEFDLERRKYLAPYQAAITGNEARASEAKLMQEWKKLSLMSQQEQMNLLNQQYKQKAMTAVDLDNEKRQADILFKQYQNQWAKMGITSSDNLLLRIFVRMISDSGFQGDIGKLINP